MATRDNLPHRIRQAQSPMVTNVHVLLLPGWLDSGPGHWQTLWAERHGDRRVEQANWQHPLRGDWMVRLEEAVLAADRSLLLAAHSLGCHLVAAWAAHSKHTAQVRGALLVAPPDLTREDAPPQLFSWRQVVRQRLPFRALVVASDNDPFAARSATERLAADWGAPVEWLCGAGHVNAESGLADWAQGRAWLQNLASAT